MSKKKKKTYFYSDCARKYDGTIGQLKLLISQDEWDKIVESTITFMAFLEVLKEKACGKLDFTWDRKDDLFLRRFKKTVNEMKQIDPLLVSKLDFDQIKTSFTTKADASMAELDSMIEEIRSTYNQQDSNTISVSNL